MAVKLNSQRGFPRLVFLSDEIFVQYELFHLYRLQVVAYRFVESGYFRGVGTTVN